MTRLEDLSSALGPSAFSGRWIKSPGGFLKASWGSSSVSFLFTGTRLSFHVGPGTESRYEVQGGPPIAIRAGPTKEATLKSSTYWRTVDPVVNSEVIVFDETTESKPQKKTFVQIMLIGWASSFELGALVCDDGGMIEPLPPNCHDEKVNILFIGDSISSGFVVPIEEGGEQVPFGVLDIFPFIAQRHLLENEPPRNVAVDLMAHPGFTLVSATDHEEEGFPTGMCDAFFHSTPWDTEPFEAPSPDSFPKAIVIELGTNDQSFDVPFERFAATLEEFVTKLAKMFEGSLRYIWLVPPFPDEDTDNRELSLGFPSLITRLEAKLGKKLKFQICDLVDGLTIADTVDGVHPKLAVHLEMGKKLANFISSNLDKGDL